MEPTVLVLYKHRTTTSMSNTMLYNFFERILLKLSSLTTYQSRRTTGMAIPMMLCSRGYMFTPVNSMTVFISNISPYLNPHTQLLNWCQVFACGHRQSEDNWLFMCTNIWGMILLLVFMHINKGSTNSLGFLDKKSDPLWIKSSPS